MKKLLCLLLAALMLLSLVACGETADDPAADESKDQGTQNEVETADPNYICDLPTDLNFKDATIGILYADVNNKGDELVSEEYGLGVVPDAVYERNVAVQEWLKVEFEFYPETDASMVANTQTLDIQSGQGDYDIIANGTYMSVQPAMEGKYINLTPLENIDTSKHYWTQGYNDMVTFTDENMQFLASGPIAISMFRFMYLTLYNKTLFVDNQIPDLYETVKEGKWTLDYQYSIVKDHYVDKDGDSKASEGDFYGFTSTRAQPWTTSPITTSSSISPMATPSWSPLCSSRWRPTLSPWLLCPTVSRPCPSSPRSRRATIPTSRIR